MVEAGQKKKRARRGSKEGGPDGGKGAKRRRKKDKNIIPQPTYTMSTVGQVPAMPSGMIMQAIGPQGTSECLFYKNSLDLDPLNLNLMFPNFQ